MALPDRAALEGRAMKHARIWHQGRAQHAVESHGALLLDDGQRVACEAASWLPPLAPINRARSIICLGLNYSDHAKELSFKPPEEPLVFLKGQSSLTGHGTHVPRPAHVHNMHYECELAVVIGRTAQRVRQSDAYDFVQGYCIANDFAIRDYLENWYRPNLKVKSRPGCTPLGPWLVDAQDVPNPMQLKLRTRVNGQLIQQGNTAQMIFSVPYLIEYLSSFMTLQAGDVILTGTPDGVVDCPVGSQVACEIEGLGALINTMVEQV
jgi:5-oxopent-3-ene-1,2,5-tricarboxylate decarboxylase / 2-hydroxyhepta-2,4-diene-1,7-dioate isomerase